MMSKICELDLLAFKEPWNAFRSVQRHGSRRSEVTYHIKAHWLSRGKFLERMFQLRQELRVSLLNKDTQCPLIFKAICDLV